MKDKYNSQIIRFDGNHVFMEVLNSCFQIGKVQMNFFTLDKDTNAQTQKLEIYIDISKMLALTNEIMCGNLQKKIAYAKRTGKFNGVSINDYTAYYLNMGGIKEQRIIDKFNDYKASFPWVVKGKGISRQFKIQSGKKYPYLLRAEYSIGQSDEKGLIVPQGRPLSYVTIPLTSENFEELAATVDAHIRAYLNQYYYKFGNKLFPDDKCNIWTPDPSKK